MAPEPPDSEQTRSLSSWSRAHGVKLVAPARAAPLALTVDARIADAVEARLETARDAIGARDGDGADRALSSADGMLRAHPELPQAAWLMAEVERSRAARWRRVQPTDPEAADGAWLRAEAIDGGRVPGVGEESSPRHPKAATVAVDVSPGDAHLWLDGAATQERDISTYAGIHAFVVTWAGSPVWAEWVEAPPGRSTVHVDAPGAAECSVEDVARAHVMSQTVGTSRVDRIEALHVQCGAWVAANPGTGVGSVRMALCETDRCGTAFEWRPSAPWTWAPPTEYRSERKGLPWATWSLVGLGVAIATGVAVVASGALQPTPTETRFVSGGIKRQ